MWFFKIVRGWRARNLRPVLRLGLLMGVTLVFVQCAENPLQPDIRGPNEVWIQSTGFDPSTLTVAVGTTVTWTNKDNVRHDVASGLPNNYDTAFDPSPNLSPNATFSVTFNRRGTFNYFCLIHQNNHGTGKIVVQ